MEKNTIQAIKIFNSNVFNSYICDSLMCVSCFNKK